MSSSRVQLRWHTMSDSHVFFLIPIPGAADLELKIPCADAAFFSTAPVRWLLLIGYGTLGVQGHIVDVASPDANAKLALDTPSLKPGHIYRFTVSNDADKTNLHNINPPNRRNEDRENISSSFSSSTSTAHPNPRSRIATTPASTLQAVSKRDADRCIFSIAYGRDETDICHIISPNKHVMRRSQLSRVAKARGFAFTHHLDVRNMITLDMRIHSYWNNGGVFILATDPRFLRDADIPQPTGPLLRLDAQRAALAEYQPSTHEYILQISPETLSRPHGIHLTHRHNERAVFLGIGHGTGGDGDDSHLQLPDVEALHWLYAGCMLMRYGHPRQWALLVRKEPGPDAEIVPSELTDGVHS